MCIICHTTMIFCNETEKELFICTHILVKIFLLFIFFWICVKVVQVEVIEYS